MYGPGGVGNDLLLRARDTFLRGASAWPSVMEAAAKLQLMVGVTCSGDGERPARTVVGAPFALAAGTCADSYRVQVRIMLDRTIIYEIVVAAHYAARALAGGRTEIVYSHDTHTEQNNLVYYPHIAAELNLVERGACTVIEEMTDYYRLDRGGASDELWRGE